MFQTIRLLVVALWIAAIVLVIRYATPLLYPFLISLLIALVINRPVTWLTEKGRLPRWLAVLVMLLVVIAVLGGLVTLVVAETVVELGHLITRLPSFVSELSHYLQQAISADVQRLYNRFEFFYQQLDESYQQSIYNQVGQTITAISEAGKNLVVDFLNAVYGLLLSLPNLATNLVISLLGAFFISKDFPQWKRRIQRLLPGGVNRRISQILADLRGALFGFVKAQLTLISLTAAIVIIGLLILRVPYAVTIGLLTGAVDLLPYLGTGTVFVPWILYSFFKGNYSLVIGLSVLYAIVLVFRQIIEPKVVAENVGLDPLLTLVALFVGLKLFGFVGLILGPVGLVIINAFIKARVFQDVWSYIATGRPAA